MIKLEDTLVTPIDGLQFRHRPGYDKVILTKEWGPYAKRLLPPRSTDRWLDLGAHIGLFTCHVAKIAEKVYAIEASPDNFWLLQQNIILNNLQDNVVAHNLAAVGFATDQEVELYLNTHENTGLHSLVTKRGRQMVKVRASGIGSLLLGSKANKVKMDIEGGEWNIFQRTESHPFWAHVDELIMEYHFNTLGDKDHSKYHELIGLLKTLFQHVDYVEDPKGAWTCMIHAHSGTAVPYSNNVDKRLEMLSREI